MSTPEATRANIIVSISRPSRISVRSVAQAAEGFATWLDLQLARRFDQFRKKLNLVAPDFIRVRSVTVPQPLKAHHLHIIGAVVPPLVPIDENRGGQTSAGQPK